MTAPGQIGRSQVEPVERLLTDLGYALFDVGKVTITPSRLEVERVARDANGDAIVDRGAFATFTDEYWIGP